MEKRKIILCPNPYRDKDMHVAAQSKAILDEAGFETVVCLPFQKEGYGADLGLPIGQLPQEIKRADLLIAFGGDGTILHLAKTVAMNNVPVLGIALLGVIIVALMLVNDQNKPNNTAVVDGGADDDF